MGSTKLDIVKLGESLIRHQGFNAFSYYDISKALGIKPAAIHYHFPKKHDLGIAVLQHYGSAFDALTLEVQNKSSSVKLIAFLNIFSMPCQEGTLCIMGALTPDLHTFQEPMKAALGIQVERILDWLKGTLEEGRDSGEMSFSEAPRTKALLIITNMLASLSITRITAEADFEAIKRAILQSTIT